MNWDFLYLWGSFLKDMKRTLFFAIALITGIFCSIWFCKPNEGFEVKIMSYNVRHCSGMDLMVDYDRTAKVIIKNQPDVVALQELDSMTSRSGRKYQLEELANRTNFYPTFGKAIDYDGGGYGVGILTKEKPLSTKRIPLPGEEPTECIDYVATFNNCQAKTLESIVIEEKEASDHRPLLVRLSFR